MESVTIPENLMFIVVIIGIVVQLLREFASLDKFHRFIPYVSILCGIVYCFFSIGYPDCIMIGVAIGLMASGGYSAINAFSATKKLEDAAAQSSVVKTLSLILVAVLLFLPGCTASLFTAEQQALLQESQVIVSELDTRCQAGDPNACRDGLHQAAITLHELTGTK